MVTKLKTKKADTKKSKTSSKSVKSKKGAADGQMIAGDIDKQRIETFTRHALRTYGGYVVENRAVPDYRDGLKPVHRAILWSLAGLNLRSTSGFKKAARLVGECFAEGTPVRTAYGKDVPIEDLVIGDMVLTDKGAFPVTELYFLDDKTLYRIETDFGTVDATPDQIFFCIDDKGNEVERTPLTLRQGDKIKRI